MFIAALFTIAKTWKQPRRPLAEEWMKMWYKVDDLLTESPVFLSPSLSVDGNRPHEAGPQTETQPLQGDYALLINNHQVSLFISTMSEISLIFSSF